MATSLHLHVQGDGRSAHYYLFSLYFSVLSQTSSLSRSLGQLHSFYKPTCEVGRRRKIAVIAILGTRSTFLRLERYAFQRTDASVPFFGRISNQSPTGTNTRLSTCTFWLWRHPEDTKRVGEVDIGPRSSLSYQHGYKGIGDGISGGGWGGF